MALDEMEVRRWFRQRLKAIADAYPQLTAPDRQLDLEDWLQEEENKHAESERPEAGKRNS
jgi:hypothetical protein